MGSSYFLAMLNGLIPVGIVAYRVIFVCKSSWVMTDEQRKHLNFLLLGQLFGVCIILTSAAIFYKEYSKDYLECIGDIKINTDRSGPRWNLQYSHPFLIASILTFASRTFVVPVGYALIFWYREKKATEMTGLSEVSRANRRARNAVNAKFNFFIWLSEMSSFIVIIFRGKITTTIFFLVSFGVSPVLYLIGMEEMRVEFQSLWQSLL